MPRSRDGDRGHTGGPRRHQGCPPERQRDECLAGIRRLRAPRRRERPARQGCSGCGHEGFPRPAVTPPAAGMKPFYITTPIYYINARPHVGNAYTTIVADAVARSQRLLGRDVFFLTGTDEHGQKVERAAQKAGRSTPDFADEVAAAFRQMCVDLNISNNDFIRTTE